MMEKRRTDKMFYLCCTEPIFMQKEFFELEFVKSSGIPVVEKLNMVEAHGDEILSLPEGFVTYGSSKWCKIEVFASKNERYFGVQGHPEYTSDFHASRVGSIIVRYFEKNEDLDACEKRRQEYLEKDFNVYENSEYEWRCLCYNFLKSPLAKKVTSA